LLFRFSFHRCYGGKLGQKSGGPEHSFAVNQHLDWWTEIWKGQESRGITDTYVTPEFGPFPYNPQEIGGGDMKNLQAINRYIKGRVVERYIEQFGKSNVPKIDVWVEKGEGEKKKKKASSSSSSSLPMLDEETIKIIATPALALTSAVEAFTAISNGKLSSPFPMQLQFPERGGETCVKAGHLHDSEFYVVKIASGFSKNKEEGVASGSGIMMLFDR